ncbi:MAG: hypothetical protein QM730_14040 [Anaerolineales bacterium]
MNRTIQFILDELTYKDLAGKRQLRSYTTIALLVLLILTLGYGFLQRGRLMKEVQVVPSPIVIMPEPTQEPTSTPQPILSYEPGCPKDTAHWSLADTVLPDRYEIIQPACVYEGLERTIAWALAVRNGYSRAEATQALGFTEMPMKQLQQVTILSETQSVMDVPVSFIPSNPDFTEWHVDAYGNPSTVYALRGCFRTSTVAGNQVEMWGGEYPVICVVIEDALHSQVVYQLGDHLYTSSAVPTRSFLLFGYAGEGAWLWLGTQTDPKLEINNVEQFARDRLTTATL